MIRREQGSVHELGDAAPREEEGEKIRRAVKVRRGDRRRGYERGG